MLIGAKPLKSLKGIPHPALGDEMTGGTGKPTPPLPAKFAGKGPPYRCLTQVNERAAKIVASPSALRRREA